MSMAMALAALETAPLLPTEPDWGSALPFLETLANGVDCGVLLLSDDERVVLVNDALAGMFGLTPDAIRRMPPDALARHVAGLIDDPPRLLREGRMVPPDGHVVCEQLELARPARLVLRWVARRIVIPAPAIMVVCTDVTAEVDITTAYERLSVTDRLTGLSNRRGAEQVIRREMVRVRRQAAPLSFVLLDVDGFAKVNATYGPGAGDQILRQVGRSMASSLRESDLTARWEGEKFLLVLPDTALNQARACAERVRGQIERLQLHLGARVTISGGVVQVGPGEPFVESIERAQSELRAAKDAGRNQIK